MQEKKRKEESSDLDLRLKACGLLEKDIQTLEVLRHATNNTRNRKHPFA